MTVIVLNKLRRMVAGLVVLAILVLSMGQSFALSVGGTSPFNGSSHSTQHALATSTGAAHGHSGLPCKHDQCPKGTADCIACGCSMPFTWFPAVTPAQLTAAPRPLVYHDIFEMAPDGAGTAPDIPPPRNMV